MCIRLFFFAFEFTICKIWLHFALLLIAGIFVFIICNRFMFSALIAVPLLDHCSIQLWFIIFTWGVILCTICLLVQSTVVNRHQHLVQLLRCDVMFVFNLDTIITIFIMIISITDQKIENSLCNVFIKSKVRISPFLIIDIITCIWWLHLWLK